MFLNIITRAHTHSPSVTYTHTHTRKKLRICFCLIWDLLMISMPHCILGKSAPVVNACSLWSPHVSEEDRSRYYRAIGWDAWWHHLSNDNNNPIRWYTTRPPDLPNLRVSVQLADLCVCKIVVYFLQTHYYSAVRPLCFFHVSPATFFSTHDCLYLTWNMLFLMKIAVH